MRYTKKLFTLTMVILMIVSFSTAVFADEASFDTTKAFLQSFKDVDGVKCTVLGIEETGSGDKVEVVEIQYDGEMTERPVLVAAGFPEDNGSLHFYFYNFAAFDSEHILSVMGGVNALNAACSWVKFYVDPTDSTVTAVMDLYANADNAGEIGIIGFEQLIKTTAKAGQTLAGMLQ